MLFAQSFAAEVSKDIECLTGCPVDVPDFEVLEREAHTAAIPATTSPAEAREKPWDRVSGNSH